MRAWRSALMLAPLCVVACEPPMPPNGGGRTHAEPAPKDALAFLTAAMRPWPESGGPHALVLTSPTEQRVTAYDNALTALVLLRRGRRDDAGRILAALAALQREDGALPFSFAFPRPDPERLYVRSGAIAWAGYAAVEYLDADRGGSERQVVLALAHRAAAYLLAHQVDKSDDPRDGLVLGGAGSFRYDVGPDGPREELVAGEIPWASVEHNIDAFFFLRALARVTGTAVYRKVADRISRALLDRAWSDDLGQMHRGIGEQGPDDLVLALDCASWGALFLTAVSERARAETALRIADSRYASRDPKAGARGHKAYARGPIFENRALADLFAHRFELTDWDRLDAVWPEGSAGVALAAWRLGHRDRAEAILDGLERMRRKDGAVPTHTVDVPFNFDTEPGIAGTAWIELVRFDLARPLDKQTLWIER